MKVSLVIPAYNEEKAIPGVIREAVEVLEASPYEWEIVVVDDGSSDGTADIAVSFPEVNLVRHPYNMGGGRARNSGIDKATGDVVVITDGDGTYPMQDIPRLVEELEDCDMVVGARTREAGTMKALRIPAKFVIRKLAEFISGSKIPDLNSGMRAMRKEIMLPYLHMLPPGHSWVSTITLILLNSGRSVKYVPIAYYPRKGKSTFHPIRDTGSYLMTIFRTITWFSPLKIFLPLGLLLLLGGFAKLIADFVRYNWSVTPSTVILLLGGLQILVLGLIADLIVKRSGP
ncbi:MAG: glycosyltransferase family 2 protein [Actinomycetota bacterium]|nr:glycosyltransferase family 2 protein [Actinomycetota bacterium]